MDFKTAFISLGFLQSEHPLTIADQSASYIHLILYFYGFLSFSNLCREREKKPPPSQKALNFSSVCQERKTFFLINLYNLNFRWSKDYQVNCVI